ncbi:type II secretion system F family protein [Nocardioides ginkgobilobae]
MTPAWWGALLGAAAGTGLLLVVARLRVMGRAQLSDRVLPYVRDLPQVGARTIPRRRTDGSPLLGAAVAVYGPVLRTLAETVERVLGGATSVRRRIERAGLDLTVQDFRVQQVVWGLVGLGTTAAWGLLRTLGDDGGVLGHALVSLVAFAFGVLARDTHLTSQVRTRERRVVAEFPTIAELLALSVAAGESPVGALDRVVQRSRGELSRDLAAVLAAIRTGEPVGSAFDRLAATTGVPVVARFAQGVAVAVERGTPLADVLHAQAADVREAGRRELIETAARREVLMMVPVVFLVLPVTVLFAFWPGLVGLSLTAP